MFIIPLRSAVPVVRGIVFCGLLLTLAFGCWSCSRGSDPGKLETVTIGATPIELNALIYVADERGFFLRNGVRPVFKDYDTGAAAVDGLLKKDVDIALTTEFVIAGKLLRKQDLLYLATIDKSMLFSIITRGDRGIKTMADLKGKRIGIPPQTITGFYLGRMLELHRMRIQQVTLVDTRASDPAGAIARGDVDAVVTWEPYVTGIKRHMGDSVNIWPVQSGQMSFWSLAGTREWVGRHPDLVRRFLKSLAEAEDYLIRHSADVRTILRGRLNLDDAYIAAIWPQNQFSLSLDPSLIVAMEDETRWMIKNRLTTERKIPDFLDYIYEDGLKAIKPEAVSIRH